MSTPRPGANAPGGVGARNQASYGSAPHLGPSLRSRCYSRAAVTRQTVFERSSGTSRAPRPSTVTPTGRPRVLPSSPMNPSRKSTGGPEGRPLLNGTNTTLYPAGDARFQLPCSPTNTPSANLLPMLGEEKDTPSAATCDPRL